MSAGLHGQRVVFVGRRQGALEEAARLGIEVLLASDRAPGRRHRPPILAHHPWRPRCAPTGS